MALTDWGIVSRSMSGRRFSTGVTVASVAVAVALMTLLVSMKTSGRQAFERGTGNAQMLISREPGPLASVLNSMFYADVPGNDIPWADFERLRASYPFAWAVPTAFGDSYRGLPVMATTREFFTEFQPAPNEPFVVREGRLFEDNFELVIGAEAARRTSLRVGSVINVFHGAPRSPDAHVHNEFDYTVVGILAPTGSAHDRALFSDLESSWVLHAHDRRVDELGRDITTTVADLIDADRRITAVYASIGRRTAALTQVLSSLRRDPEWTVAQPADTVRGLFRIVSGVDQILVAMAAAVLVSSGVSIMLALYNSMEQRRKQVAVLRVLGASRWRVSNLVLTESAAIGLMGGAIGVLLGIALGVVVSGVLEARLGLVVRPRLPIDGYLAMVLATVALSMAAGVAPAVLAYRTAVVRHLRPIG
ncbi:MAG: ABC transporter permease [Phycisphaerales bacterium]|nr:ABC transporter permease [Planctomycetota bacterium]MCH8509377.1 ABC transporter permease [Phycisphaerales bacterium]